MNRLILNGTRAHTHEETQAQLDKYAHSIPVDPGTPKRGLSDLGKLLFPNQLSARPLGEPSLVASSDPMGQPSCISTHSTSAIIVPGRPGMVGRLSLGGLPSVSSRSEAGHNSMPPTFKEFRRVCSEVLPHQLYVSGWLIAEDWSELESRGITHVINTASAVSKCPFPERVIYMPLSIDDSRNADIQSYFYPCIDFIEDAINRGGRVLVHCMEGVSRSCTVAIAYLMWKRRLTYVEAQAMVQDIRPICQPNAGFLCQLLDFQKRLQGLESNPNLRVTVRRSDTSFIVLGIPAVSTDARFAYISQHGLVFTVTSNPSGPLPETSLDMARALIERIARIESIAGFRMEYVESSVGSTDASLDGEFADCLQYQIQCRRAPEPIRAYPADDGPYTSRSHKSRGSIDSVTKDSRVRVYQIDETTEVLDNPIPYFDADDLHSLCVYLFTVQGTIAATLWIGNEVHNSDDVQLIGQARKLMSEECEIHVIPQGQETEEFWSLFFEG